MAEAVPILATLLLIDDDPSFCVLVEAIIRPQMLTLQHIVTAGTLATGLAILANDSIDCVVLDLGIPRDIGQPQVIDLEGMRAIRQRFQVPLLILTGREDHRLALLAEREGVPYLSKTSVVEEHTSLPTKLQHLWTTWHSPRAAVMPLVAPVIVPADQSYWQWRGEMTGEIKALREAVAELRQLQVRLDGLQQKVDTLVVRLAGIVSGAVAVASVLGYVVPKWLEKLFGSAKP